MLISFEYELISGKKGMHQLNSPKGDMMFIERAISQIAQKENVDRCSITIYNIIYGGDK